MERTLARRLALGEVNLECPASPGLILEIVSARVAFVLESTRARLGSAFLLCAVLRLNDWILPRDEIFSGLSNLAIHPLNDSVTNRK